MINRELRRYIFNYYGSFLDKQELDDWNEIIEEDKLIKKKCVFKIKKKWTKKKKQLFYEETINRLLTAYKNEILINKCSICNTLARTPYSKFCRNGHKKVKDVWINGNTD